MSGKKKTLAKRNIVALSSSELEQVGGGTTSSRPMQSKGGGGGGYPSARASDAIDFSPEPIAKAAVNGARWVADHCVLW
jgi:hypothetical protein